MPIVTKETVLAAKIETTKGTAEALTGTDAAFNIYNPNYSPGVSMTQREGQGGYGRIPAVAEAYLATITFSTDISWDGVNLPSWATTFLPACAFVASGNSYKSVTGTATGVKTLTMAVYQGGTVKKISGASGNFVINGPVGKNATIDWTFTGKMENEADVSMLAPTYPEALASRFANGFFKWNNVSLCPSVFTLNANNVLYPMECPTGASGISYVIVSDRNPTVDADPLAELVGTAARQSQWLARNEYELAIQIPGVTGSVDIVAAKAQLLNKQDADRSGVRADNLNWQCNKNGSTANEELIITFTEAS